MSTLLALLMTTSFANPVSVDSADGLRQAMQNAEPGDEILVAPGTYRFTSKVSASANGTRFEPITVRADQPNSVLIEMDTVEGFYVTGAHWVFEELEIEGVCASDSACEHAFHIVGDAEGTVLRSNVVRNFNAHIKANANSGRYADDVLVEGNVFENDAPRQTSNPVVAIDVVGGQRWTIRSNIIRDMAKAQGNQVSYAAFLKGNGRDGIFENNLVICEFAHSGYARVGLSLGGGGSAPDSICEEQDCSTEHTGGILRNNIIANCPDVGIYLSEAADTLVQHNTLYDTAGIDVRFGPSTATLEGNILDGRIRERDGGTALLGDNLEYFGGFSATYRDPDNFDFRVASGADIADLGLSTPEVDFCWKLRTQGADAGAVEVGSDCSTWRPQLPSAAGGGGDGTGGNGGGGETGDTGPDGTDGADDTGDNGPEVLPIASGCGCAGGGPAPTGLLALLVPALLLRRRA